MEDKQLTTEQSLDLIAQMIIGARRNFNDTGGAMFLIWGYTTIATTLAVYIAFSLTRSHDIMWLWWAIPIMGGILSLRRMRRCKRPVRSHIDKAVSAVWQASGAAMLICMVFSFLPDGILNRPFPILFVIALLIGVATAITGLVLRFRPVAIGGFAGIVLAFPILFLGGMMEQVLFFAGLFLVVQVIPGHLLNRACKNEEYGIVDLLCGGGFLQKR